MPDYEIIDDGFEYVYGYEVYPNYADTNLHVVNPDTKEINMIDHQPLIIGESESHYIPFELERYVDGMDISSNTIEIVWYNMASKAHGTTTAVNVSRNDNYLRLGWIVPKEAATKAGKLVFYIKFYDMGEAYVFRTKDAVKDVVDSIVKKAENSGDYVPDKTVDERLKALEAVGGGSITKEDLSTIFKDNLKGMIENEIAFVSTSHPYADALVAYLDGEDVPDTPTDPEEPDPPTPTRTLQSISATYTGGDVDVGTLATELTGITVTGHYNVAPLTQTVTGWTITGNVQEGNNVFTISYSGKTTTISVTGVAVTPPEDIPVTWVTGNGGVLDNGDYGLKENSGYTARIFTKEKIDALTKPISFTVPYVEEYCNSTTMSQCAMFTYDSNGAYLGCTNPATGELELITNNWHWSTLELDHKYTLPSGYLYQLFLTSGPFINNGSMASYFRAGYVSTVTRG